MSGSFCFSLPPAINFKNQKPKTIRAEILDSSSLERTLLLYLILLLKK